MVRWYLALAAASLLVVPGLAASGATRAEARGVAAVAAHTTFVTLDVVPEGPEPIPGLAVCRQTLGPFTFRAEGLLAFLGGCGDRASRVMATPDAFPSPAPGALLTPTGRERTVEDARGVAHTTVEHAFALPSGGYGVTYLVDTGPIARDPATGEEYNFVLALPAIPRGAGWTTLTFRPAG